MKQTKYYRLLPLMALMMLIIASLACGSSTETPTEGPKVSTATSDVAEAEPPSDSDTSESPTEPDSPTNTPKLEPTNTPEPEPTNTPVPELYLGDAVENYGYALAGVSIQDPATPGMFYTPEDGTKLVAVEVVISNISGDMLGVNPLNATLVDSEGFTYQTELGGAEEQIPTLDLNPGERVRGLIAFQVPDNAVPGSIKYSIEVFGSKVLQASLVSPPEGHELITATPADEPPEELPNLGDVVEQFGYSLTSVMVEDPATPGMFYDPKQGYKLVAVEIIVGNVSGDILSVNPLYSYLIDSEGFVYAVELGGRDGDQIDTTDLNTGEKVKGWVAFSIPEESTPAAIKYQIEIFSSNYLYTGLDE